MSNDVLLNLFHQHSDEYVSGAKLSQELGVSRTAIWKSIRKLEAEGYEFEASTKLGYRLVFQPDKLDANSLRQSLTTIRFGQDVVLEEVMPSTQNTARTLAEADAAEGTLVIAEQQINGRGRMGRNWISPAGKGIWMSMVLRPIVPIHCAPQLTLLTAVALCRSLRRQTNLPIGIKWPNDLLVENKKVSGILLESVAEDNRLKYIVTGIGISVNLIETDFETNSLTSSVSLRMAAGKPFNRKNIISDFLMEFEQLYDLFQQEGFLVIASLWESLSISLGKRVQIHTPQGDIIGIPEGLDDSGALRVRKDDGSHVSIFSAEMGEPLACE